MDWTFIPVTEGTPTTHWCHTCQHHSAITIPLHTITPDGVTHIATYARCTNCHLPVQYTE